MVVLTDLLIGLWIAGVATVALVFVPAAAMGRPRGRRQWWPECVAGASWATMSTIALVPCLARFHLLNWATAVLVPVAWPAGLWLYRYRGAPAARFTEQCHEWTLAVMRWRPVLPRFDGLRPSPAIVALGCGLAMVGSRAVIELRLQTPADYQTLARARDMAIGGRWTIDPAASIVALLAQLSAVDPMQVLRFLHPLLVLGCVAGIGLFVVLTTGQRAATGVGAGVVAVGVNLTKTIGIASSAVVMGWAFLSAAAILLWLAAQRVHRRDWWHVGAAAVVAGVALVGGDFAGSRTQGYVEYDAAARQALRIARTSTAAESIIVAPPEQRVEMDPSRRVVGLAEFVKRYAPRAGQRQFRFDLPARDLFVFVEKRPLTMPGEAGIPGPSSLQTAAYRLPNARAAIQHAALDLCERYRHTHVGVDVYYDDDQLRVYHVRLEP